VRGEEPIAKEPLDAELDEDEAPAPDETAQTRWFWLRRSWAVPVAVAVVAVLLGGVAVLSAVRAQQLRNRAAANTALTDNAATSELLGQTTTAINTIFSYDFTKLDQTQDAAHQMLVGSAVCQYDTLFTVVREQAPPQQLVVTVTVTNSGVERLTGDSARLLMFATQTSTSAVTGSTSTAGAMFAIDAMRIDGRWKIANIDTFTGNPAKVDC
jgi:Mce-associated membrane protein